MPEIYHPDRHAIQMTEVFAALSDPHRIEIVRILANTHEQMCGTFEMGIVRSTLSHHLKVLREAGVIRSRVDGTQRYVSLRREDLDARFPGLLDAILAAQA